MKVRALTKLMNDHGTNDCSLLVYEGSPESIDEETAGLKVNSFSVLGKGFIEIHAQ